MALTSPPPPDDGPLPGFGAGGAGSPGPRRAARIAAQAGHGDGDLRRPRHLDRGTGLRLHERDELGHPLLEQIGGPVEEPSALVGRGLRPVREGLGSSGRAWRVGGRGLGGQAHDLLGGRVDDLVGAVRPAGVVAADPQGVALLGGRRIDCLRHPVRSPVCVGRLHEQHGTRPDTCVSSGWGLEGRLPAVRTSGATSRPKVRSGRCAPRSCARGSGLRRG